MSFFVVPPAAAATPPAVFTGDVLFVGGWYVSAYTFDHWTTISADISLVGSTPC